MDISKHFPAAQKKAGRGEKSFVKSRRKDAKKRFWKGFLHLVPRRIIEKRGLDSTRVIKHGHTTTKITDSSWHSNRPRMVTGWESYQFSKIKQSGRFDQCVRARSIVSLISSVPLNAGRIPNGPHREITDKSCLVLGAQHRFPKKEYLNKSRDGRMGRQNFHPFAFSDNLKKGLPNEAALNKSFWSLDSNSSPAAMTHWSTASPIVPPSKMTRMYSSARLLFLSYS